jgi:hypothetical protein
MIGLNGPLVALLLGAYVVLNACAIGCCRAAGEADRAGDRARFQIRERERDRQHPRRLRPTA